MNTTAFDPRLPGKIYETECMHRWRLLIDSHSGSIAALGSSFPLVQWMPISIAQTLLFSPMKVNGCKQTTQIHLGVGSECSILHSVLPTLKVLSQSPRNRWYRQSTRRSSGGYLWLSLLFPIQTASHVCQPRSEILVLFHHIGHGCAWSSDPHPWKWICWI